MSKLYVVVSQGNYTGLEFVYGPYTEADAEAVLKRMKEGQTQHTTKTMREHREDDVILNPRPVPVSLTV